MILCLIKNPELPQPLFIKKRGDARAFTLVELMMAVAFSTLLMMGVYGFYNTASQSYSSGISGQALQDAANIMLSKIIEGEAETGGSVYRLATAVSYMIPNGSSNGLYSCGGAPQVAPCNIDNTFGELYFCQDSPCGGAGDTTARWYYLNSTGTAVLYHHPAAGGGSVEETIYTAPDNSTMTLRFSPAAVSTPLNVVEIDVALRQNLSATTQAANTRTSAVSGSGAASTFVLLRNHP